MSPLMIEYSRMSENSYLWITYALVFYHISASVSVCFLISFYNITAWSETCFFFSPHLIYAHLI